MTNQTTLSTTELNEEFSDFAEMLSERYNNCFSKEQVLNVIPTYLEHVEEDGEMPLQFVQSRIISAIQE